MLNSVIKISFALVGAITGYTLTRTIVITQFANVIPEFQIIIYLIVSLLAAFLFYTTGNKIIEIVLDTLNKIEAYIQKMTLYELLIDSVGLIVGLIVANLVIIPVTKLNIIGVPISILINILFGCIGLAIAANKKDESPFEHFKRKNTISKNGKNAYGPKILDTSAIIDGRIVDIYRSGFIEGEIIIPSFVLEELRHIADSADSIKRNRGRRGLDVLSTLQKELDCPVRIETIEISPNSEVDSALLKAAEKLGGKVVTVDYNLNKVASLQGVPVLNVNELANAVKPIALPGEDMTVQVIKDGKENGQGIGYLDDGTMIVIDGGRRHIGENVSVTVTSVLQTAAGRMIFAKPKYMVERII
ncbi:MAG TPA: TRAM domain-containing protein [Clostridiaceae bacterium]|nr:TRAM domain-containing protein [Clostridiaceae bacterium]